MKLVDRNGDGSVSEIFKSDHFVIRYDDLYYIYDNRISTLVDNKPYYAERIPHNILKPILEIREFDGELLAKYYRK